MRLEHLFLEKYGEQELQNLFLYAVKDERKKITLFVYYFYINKKLEEVCGERCC